MFSRCARARVFFRQFYLVLLSFGDTTALHSEPGRFMELVALYGVGGKKCAYRRILLFTNFAGPIRGGGVGEARGRTWRRRVAPPLRFVDVSRKIALTPFLLLYDKHSSSSNHPHGPRLSVHLFKIWRFCSGRGVCWCWLPFGGSHGRCRRI